MSKKFIFKLNRAGVRELLRGSEMQDLLGGIANKARDTCGDGYESDTYVGNNRANAMVWADTYQAKADNSKHNSILKAVKANGNY